MTISILMQPKTQIKTEAVTGCELPSRLLMHQEHAIHYRLTAVLRELDARVHMDGKPLRRARWLHDTFGLTFGAAREEVRTARALRGLPLIDAEADAYWARRADALTHIMGDSLSDTPNRASAPGDRHQAAVHVAAEALTKNVLAETPPENVSAETRSANIPAETPLHTETIRRLACDGGLLTIVGKDNGDPINVGRKTRTIPPSTRRALLARDRHCRFPGCAHDRYVEGHHIIHWAHGGETRLDNLVLLCSRHHRAVHDFGYHIQRENDGSFGFRIPGVQKLSSLRCVGWNGAIRSAAFSI